MLSCIPLTAAEYFYSAILFSVLTLCSIFVIFADGVIYFAGYDCFNADIIIWVVVPFIILLFTMEYLMICRLFSCKILSITSCDFVYVFSILSLIVELSRITPEMKQFNYYALDEYDESYHINNAIYWKHKLFDSFIEFIVFIRIVHSILRAVLYYIYGKEYRQRKRNKNKTTTTKMKSIDSINKSRKSQKNLHQKEKDGYHATATNETDESCSSSSDETHEIEPEPNNINNHIIKIVDDDDNTAPLPAPNGMNENNDNESPKEVPIMAARNSVDLLNSSDNDEITPKNDNLAKKFKLKLNLTPLSPARDNTTPIRDNDGEKDEHIEFIEVVRDKDTLHSSKSNNNANNNGRIALNLNINNMLSPPQIQIEPSDVETQSIERIELQTFQPQYTEEQQEIDETSDDIMVEDIKKGENWGIFPMFASKLGIIGDLCVALISLFDHPYLFIVRICIFGLYFCIMMYLSAHHFVQFIRSFLDSHQPYLDKMQRVQCDPKLNNTSNDNGDKKQSTLHDVIQREDGNGRRSSNAVPPFAQEPKINKQIKSIVLNPTFNKLGTVPFDPNANDIDSQQQIQGIILNPWDIDIDSVTVPKKDIEFRTGTDEIKKIVRNMLSATDTTDNRLNYESQQRLQDILSILQDIDVMDKGNIEEKIELDEELDPEAKRWLGQTLLSKHSMNDNFSGATPHFDFNVQSTTASIDDKNPHLITPITAPNTSSNTGNAANGPQPSTPYDSPINAPPIPSLNVLNAISPQNDDIIIGVKDDIINEDKEQNYTLHPIHSYDEDIKQQENEYEYDIVEIIEDKLNISEDNENDTNLIDLKQSLIHLSPEIDKLTSQIMSFDNSLNTTELNRLTGRPLLHSSICIFLKFGFHDKLNIPFNKFYRFICKMEESYDCNNPYHNKMHATEVMMSTMQFIDCLEMTVRAMITTQQIFAAFLSAIIHDVNHPGNNNAFEINTESNKSILYSDQSVLEFHHLQFAFRELKRDQFNFTERWDKQNRKEFRKQCVYSVLSTDLSKHFDTISHIKQLKIIKETDLEWLFKSIIKMSDLSHVTKPLNQHKIWTKRITQEFHNQGDKEILNGLEVSPLCNKQNTKIAKGQVGFIKHVVSPLFHAAQRFFAKNNKYDKIIMQQLNSNRKYWEIEAKKEESITITTVTTDDGSTPKTLSTPIKEKQQRSPPKPRPSSATFTSRSRKIAILTNLEDTPPPILPSSVRGIGSYSKSVITEEKILPPTQLFATRSDKYFFSPNHMRHLRQRQQQQQQQQQQQVILVKGSGDIGKGVNNITYNFQQYSKIKGKKRHRSSSANSLELPVVNPPKYQQQISNDDNNPTKYQQQISNTERSNTSLSPRSILRLGSHAPISPKSTKSMKTANITPNNNQKTNEVFKSLTPKHAKSKNTYNRMAISPNTYHLGQKYQRKKTQNHREFMRTKSNDDCIPTIVPTIVPTIGKHSKSDNDNKQLPSHMISPYSASHSKQSHSQQLLQRNDDEHHAIIHEEKSSSDDQHFKFETVIQENK